MSKYVNVYLITIILLLVSACDSGGGFGRSLGLSADGDNNTTPGTGTDTVTTLIDTDAADNSVAESVIIGALTGLTAFVDGLADGVTVTFSLLDDAGGRFAIDPGTGVVTVAGPLDFETATSHVVTVFTQESDGNTNEANFTITVTDNLAPIITIGFPGANSLVIGDNITISGTATDPEGDAIDSIIVSTGGNDVAASVDADGNWSAAAIPLSTGDNEITVTATDVNGEVSTETISVNSQATVISAPGSALADGERERILVIDAGTGGINIVDENSGEVSPFPVDFNGGALPGSAGAEFQALSGAGELDADNDRLFVVEDTPAGDNLLQIGLTDDSVTRLPVRVEPGIDQFVVDAANNNNRLLIIDLAAPAIVAVSLVDFSTSVVSDNTGAGTGPAFVTPTRIALDSTNNQAIVFDEGIPGFLTVDLDNGNRTLLAGLPAGITDPTLVRSIEVDNANDRLLVVTPTSVFTIDLSNGGFGVLSGDDVVTPSAAVIGNGPPLIDANAITVDGTRALVSDNSGAIIAIDLATGDRTIVGSNPPVLLEAERYTNVIVDDATGNIFLYSLLPGSNSLTINDQTNGVTSTVTIDQSNIEIDTTVFIVDFVNNTAYFFTAERDGIAALNLASGSLAIVSDNNSVGSGVSFQKATALALDSARNRILYTDADQDDPSVRAIDLATGDRSIFFASTGSIPSPIAIIVDTAQDRALVLDDVRQTLIVIGLESADGTVLDSADATVINAIANTGLVLDAATLTVDSNSNIAYLIDATTRALTSVNIATGDNRVVSAIDGNSAEVSGGNQVGNGLGFIIPIAIAWDEANQRLLVADPGIRGLVVVEPNSGDRAISVL
ncbi:MAG: cadherin domain-containing protein [Gammaproteobacteria bacterium]|nr:cadherin domain-containing protein [Gammaproteobacteria bacterium]